MPIADRIQDLIHVRASDLVPHPRNPRTHPPEQRQALRALLARIGFAGAELVYLNEDGEYTLIDGHLRAEEMGDDLIPCLLTNLDPEEAEQLLLTFDQIGAAATTDGHALDALRELIGPLDDPAIESILDSIRDATYAPLVGPTADTSDMEKGALDVTCPACGRVFAP